MKKVMKFRYRILALLVLAVVLSAATYGFAAANTVDASLAGEGEGDITGYIVNNIHYSLDSSNPGQFGTVTFTLNASASNVYAGIGSGLTIEYMDIPCTGGPLDFSCDLTGVSISVAAADALHVSSVQ